MQEVVNRGSTWNAWDFHIHTPGTLLNDQFRDSDKRGVLTSENRTWEDYCKMLNESKVTCFGITDYFSIKGYKYLSEKRSDLGLKDDIVLFPNIEVRVSGLVVKNKSTAHNHVNIHLIFSPTECITKMERLLRNLIVESDGDKNITLLMISIS